MTIDRQNLWDDLFEWLSDKWINIQEKKDKLNDLINNWFITRKEYYLLISLTFTERDIIDNHTEIKFLYNLEKEWLIKFRELKHIVEINKQDIHSIRKNLERFIDINNLTINQQIKVMNILNIW